MTSKIFKQYIGLLEDFKSWLNTGTNKTDLGDAIVFIHANDVSDPAEEFTGWIYANGHYYKSGSSLKISDVANILASGNGVNVRKEGDKIYFDAVVNSDILIAGGPLASDDVIAVFQDGKIPANMTIQEVLEKLFLKERWGTPTTPTYRFTSSVEAPTLTVSKSGKVQIGTTVTCSATKNTNQVSTQSVSVSGYTYGYSLDGTTKTSTNTTYTQTKTPTLSGVDNMEATFTGLYNQEGQVISSNEGGETTAYVGLGKGTYTVEYTGQTVTVATFDGQLVYNVSNIGNVRDTDVVEVSQNEFIKTSAYQGGSITPSKSASKTVEGVWGYFYTPITSTTIPDMSSDSVNTWNWLDANPSTIKIESGVYGIAIACPEKTITNIQQSDPNSSFGTIQNKEVTIKALNGFNKEKIYNIYYIINDGSTTAPQTLTISY